MFGPGLTVYVYADLEAVGAGRAFGPGDDLRSGERGRDGGAHLQKVATARGEICGQQIVVGTVKFRAGRLAKRTRTRRCLPRMLAGNGLDGNLVVVGIEGRGICRCGEVEIVGTLGDLIGQVAERNVAAGEIRCDRRDGLLASVKRGQREDDRRPRNERQNDDGQATGHKHT